MNTTSQKKESFAPKTQASTHRAMSGATGKVVTLTKETKIGLCEQVRVH